MKTLLTTTAILEGMTGVALVSTPALLASILLGAALDTAAGLAMARLAGAAVLALALACWLVRRDVESRAASAIVAAMLLYNLSAVALLLWLRYYAGMTGLGLLPVSALHIALAAWCVVSLRAAKMPQRAR